MPNIVDHLNAITNAPSVEVLWALHSERMASFGFDRIIYGFTRYRSGGSLGDPQDWVLLTNHGDSYMEEFIGKGHLNNAPMIHWALENTGACSWNWMKEPGNLTEAEQTVVAFNKAQNVTAGYTISFLSVSERSKGATALTAKVGLSQDEVEAIWAKHGDEITVMRGGRGISDQLLRWID